MDTIAFHKTRPLKAHIDLSQASLQHVMNEYDTLKDMLVAGEGDVFAKPEGDALWFYVQQHAMGLIERNLDDDEPMGEYERFVVQYHEDIQRKMLRMFYYLIIICTRESRHASGHTGKETLFSKFPEMKDYHQNYVQDSSAESAVQSIIDNAPDVTLGEYTQFLVAAFTYPSYSDGYGGKAWRDVARPLRDFVQGKISGEIMVDTAFTLAHNNGPIFNKGMLYHGYNSNPFHKILDVQRSGQIPQLIAQHLSDLTPYITGSMIQYVDDFSKLDSGFSGHVDWHQVKNIKGECVYHAEMAAQKVADKSTGFMEKLKETAAKAKAAAAKLALLKGSIEIAPGVLIPKGKRSQS